MRKFEAEVATEVNWERNHRTILVKACTFRGAIQRVIKKKNHDEFVHHITTNVRGIPTIIWDYFYKENVNNIPKSLI
jgi:hypothetical protein